MAAPSPAPQDRYRVLRRIGKGGMGTVYEATDLRLNRRVAWKETAVDNEASARQARREARVLANLQHSHLPKVLDHFSSGQKEILIMEFIGGEDLQGMLGSRSVGFPPLDVTNWALQLLEVLSYLHSHNPPVVHRDIKPANLKLDVNGEIVLLDFGLAKGPAQTTAVAASRSVYGYTLNYAPPEQIKGSPTTPRSDIYSFGATMYHLLTGVMPPDAFTRLSGIVDDGVDPLRSLSEFNIKCNEDFRSLIEQSLSLKVEHRPFSAGEMLQLLRSGRKASANPTILFDDGLVMTPTIKGQTTLVADPPRVVPTFQDIAESGKQPNKNGRLVPLVILGVIGVVVLALGLFLAKWAGSGSVANTVANSKPGIVIPSPYNDLTKSIVSVQMTDGSGQVLPPTTGFFVRSDEIATTATAIDGAVSGKVTNGTDTFAISSVTSLDRDHKIVILKIAGANSSALTLNNASPLDPISVVLLGRSEANDSATYTSALANYRKGDDLFDLHGVTVASGTPLLDERGSVLGLVTTSDSKTVTAVPTPRIVALLKKVSQPLSLTVAGANKLLFDYSRFANNDSEPSKKVNPTTQRKVLNAVFGSYLTDPSQCSNSYADASTPEGLRELRKAGFIVPYVTSTARGSFTRVGVDQTAYVLFVGECGAPHAVNWGTKRLAVFEGDSLVLNIDIKEYSEVDGSFDIDGDGLNELLLSGGYMGMGEALEWAELVAVRDGKIQILHDFKEVMRDSCGTGQPKSSRYGSAIYYTLIPGKLPDFRLDSKRSKCPDQ